MASSGETTEAMVGCYHLTVLFIPSMRPLFRLLFLGERRLSMLPGLPSFRPSTPSNPLLSLLPARTGDAA